MHFFAPTDLWCQFDVVILHSCSVKQCLTFLKSKVMDAIFGFLFAAGELALYIYLIVALCSY